MECARIDGFVWPAHESGVLPHVPVGAAAQPAKLSRDFWSDPVDLDETMTDPRPPHVPVLLDEVLAALEPVEGEVVVDGTFGAGGYARALLGSADIKLIGIDRDPRAIAIGQDLAAENPRFSLLPGTFGDMAALLDATGIGQVDAIVLDIGVSSMQVDDATRGFSFTRDGPLDMRMSQTGETAADLVNRLGETQLADILYRYGEERASRRIARAIVARRHTTPLETTLDLADTIAACFPPQRPKRGRPKPIHPATRSFQALRIAVNDELGQLVEALVAAEHLLKPGGRLAIVTFHSLEDRIVKRFFASRSQRGGGGSRHEPGNDAVAPSFSLKNRSGVTPSENEIEINPRARSARLRAGVRTAAPAIPIDRAMLGIPTIAATEPVPLRGRAKR